jgi:hypothetical protein
LLVSPTSTAASVASGVHKALPIVIPTRLTRKLTRAVVEVAAVVAAVVGLPPVRLLQLLLRLQLLALRVTPSLFKPSIDGFGDAFSTQFLLELASRVC